MNLMTGAGMPNSRQQILEPARERTGQRRRPASRVTSAGPTCMTILGVDVDRLDRRQARAAVLALAQRPGHDAVAFVNAHALNVAVGDPRYRAALHRTSLLLNDGLGIGIAARLDGATFPDNLNGTDLLPDLLRDLATAGRSVFFYGAAPGVAGATASLWARRIPGLRIAGALDGFTVSGEAAAEIVRGSGADVVLVALGNPRQEIWASELGERTGAGLTIGVGAFFDFSVGVVRRAPRIVRHVRMEWAFRVLQEPRRLTGRYLVGNPAFLARVALSRVRPPAPPDPASARRRHPSASWSEPLAADARVDVVVRGLWPRVDSDVDRAG